MGAFQLFVRRDPGYELRVSVKFTVNDGSGILSLPQRGRSDRPPGQAHEETDVSSDALRGGRFIHLIHDSGKRQSYALSRLTADKLARLPDSAWTELEATTEFGFRYAVLPDSALQSGGVSVSIAPAAAAAASGAVAAVRPKPVASASVAAAKSAPPPELGGGTPPEGLPAASGTPAGAGALSAARRPTPVASASGTGAAIDDEPTAQAPITAPMPQGDSGAGSAADLPPRPVPVDAALAASALKALKKDELSAKLQREMEKVQALHEHIGHLERKLGASRSRERDLLGVLSRWQERED